LVKGNEGTGRGNEDQSGWTFIEEIVGD